MATAKRIQAIIALLYTAQSDIDRLRDDLRDTQCTIDTDLANAYSELNEVKCNLRALTCRGYHANME